MKNILTSIALFLASMVGMIAMTIFAVILVLGLDVLIRTQSKSWKKNTEVRNATVETLILTTNVYSVYDFCTLRTGTTNVYSVSKARVSRSLSKHIKPGQRVGYISIKNDKFVKFEVIEVYQGDIPAENENVVYLMQ